MSTELIEKSAAAHSVRQFRLRDDKRYTLFSCRCRTMSGASVRQRQENLLAIMED